MILDTLVVAYNVLDDVPVGLALDRHACSVTTCRQSHGARAADGRGIATPYIRAEFAVEDPCAVGGKGAGERLREYSLAHPSG